MDEVKGKGFLGVGIVLFLILYYDLDLNSMKIYGLDISAIGKDRIMKLLGLTWFVLGFRYWQTINDELENMNLEFLIKYVKSHNIRHQNDSFVMKGPWKITYRPEISSNHRESINLLNQNIWINYLDFAFRERAFLNLLMPLLAHLIGITLLLLP